MTYSLIPQHTINDGFDRQNLSILRKRFIAVNSDRLNRMRSALATRHQVFLDALPMLFHCNHPMLPGFVNRKTPCKISGFKPQKKDITATKTLARSFTVHYEPDISEDIYGIYVMGSVGTIAQSERSDVDIWLCHRPGLRFEQLHLLQRKCDLITEWAASQRLEAHFFLMDCNAFKQGKLSSLDKESSGSAQRMLLLDEFYRSAIYIAGRTPLWWYVPERNETDYQSHAHELLEKRFVTPHHVLDFGGLAEIPGGEFIGAGIWQLYKAIESPYKSVLKLLLLEVYVSEYPHIRPLSLSYKNEIFAGKWDIDYLDSYVMIYRRIEEYLRAQGQFKRLELARRCFYFKVNRALSRSSKHSARPWQRELLKSLVDEWGWSDEDLHTLDSRNAWKVARVASERAQLVNELNFSYQFLLEFAQAQNIDRSISVEELTVLGRKLQAAFERRPGKIDWINPNISSDLSEDVVGITQTAARDGQPELWTAQPAGVSANSRKDTSIRSSTSLVELLLWCYYNRIVESHTYLDLTNVKTVSAMEAKKILSVFEQWLPNPGKSAAHENFFETAKPLNALILLNVGALPSPELSQHGLQRLSENTDAFRYGGREENLVVSADLCTTNSWNELHVRRFEKPTALLDCLQEFLQLSLPGTHQSAPELRIECIGSDHSSTIAHRVQEWISEITRCFYSPNAGRKRYLFQLSEKLHRLQFKGMRPAVKAFSSENELIASLAEPQREFSGIAVDSHCLRKTPIPLIANKMRRNAISVFYRHYGIGMEIYIADEKGSISRSIIRDQHDQNPLVPMHRFLRAAINRQARSQPDLLADFGICPIYFYEVVHRPGQVMSARQTPISQSIRQTNMFEVKAIAYSDDNETIYYDFYCDDQEFSYRSFKDQLFLVVAQFVISRRDRGEDYPIYMTDLDLSLCDKLIAEDGELQLTHYLNVKSDLETKLNDAIGVLANA